LDSVPSELFQSIPAARYNEVSNQTETPSQETVNNQPNSQENQNSDAQPQETQAAPEDEAERGT